jgi:hypothetical protein
VGLPRQVAKTKTLVKELESYSNYYYCILKKKLGLVDTRPGYQGTNVLGYLSIEILKYQGT